MKAKVSLVFGALILGTVFCFIDPRTTAQVLNKGGLGREDLTLLDQRTNPLGSGQKVFEAGEATMSFSEATLATNCPILKLGGTGSAPVICEIRSPCRVVIKSSKPGERMHVSLNRQTKGQTYSGRVKVGVFMREKPVFDLTADEVKVEY